MFWIVDAWLHYDERRLQEMQRRASAAIHEQIEHAKTSSADTFRVGVSYHPEQSKIEAAEFVKQLADLEGADNLSLQIEWLPQTDEFLEQIKSLTGLKDLHLDCCEMNERGAECIASFPHLETLYLTKMQITDTAIEKLEAAPALSELWLAPSNETGLTIPTVLALPHLRKLTLSGFYSSWFHSQLKQLERATMLTELTLTYIQPAEVDGLRAQLPDCVITARVNEK